MIFRTKPPWLGHEDLPESSPPCPEAGSTFFLLTTGRWTGGEHEVTGKAPGQLSSHWKVRLFGLTPGAPQMECDSASWPSSMSICSLKLCEGRIVPYSCCGTTLTVSFITWYRDTWIVVSDNAIVSLWSFSLQNNEVLTPLEPVQGHQFKPQLCLQNTGLSVVKNNKNAFWKTLVC